MVYIVGLYYGLVNIILNGLYYCTVYLKIVYYGMAYIYYEYGYYYGNDYYNLYYKSDIINRV